MGLITRLRGVLSDASVQMRVLTGFSIWQLGWYAWYRLRRTPRPARSALTTRDYVDARSITRSRWRQSEIALYPVSARFLNIDRRLIFPECWFGNLVPRLWTYKLHYFDDLRSVSSTHHRKCIGELLDRWIDDNPVGYGPGWEPYPLSIRLYNTVQWFLTNPEERTQKRLQSLSVQARYLRRSLEHHVGGNHLWANAKALIASFYLFSGPESREWHDKGVRLLRKCMSRQVGCDGAHEELTPMYQGLLVEDLLDLLDLDRCRPGITDAAVIAEIRQTLIRMITWLAFMCHPDGKISYFNDANFDLAPKPSLLIGRARDDGIAVGIDSCREGVRTCGGFTRMEMAKWCLVADTAPAGSRGTPGHIHADTLSFELSVGSERIIVNSGTSTYEIGRRRLIERSTRAHSTVEVDGASSSEVTGSFRTGRLARIKYLNLETSTSEIRTRAVHDGYRGFGTGVFHERIWRMSNQSVTITDRLKSGGVRRVRLRMYLSPDLEVIEWDSRTGTFVTPSGQTLTISLARHCGRLRHGSYRLFFNVSVENRFIEVMTNGARSISIVIEAK